MISKLLSNYSNITQSHWNKKISCIYADFILDMFHSCAIPVSVTEKKSMMVEYMGLPIRLNQLSKMKINRERNTFKGMISVITEVTYVKQADTW